ncbi:MAG: serine/threonine protein kinase, partial [Myxococcales bacterium]|nr:serine/threonine protein kinase [Myxococcales bacterium]
MSGSIPQVGQFIASRYELTRLIGRGGFATVYEAVDEAVGGKVAVKILHQEGDTTAQLVERFQQEAYLIRGLLHPNTIKVTDVGQTESGHFYMVQEYLEGETLDRFAYSQGGLSAERIVHIMDQVLRSVAEAHAKGIVHRDLKPENVMIINMSGEQDFVKVLDFGIAKPLDTEVAKAHTRTGMVFCTPKYAPPEVLIGKDIYPTADVYSLGIMFIELLAGHPPFEAASEAELVAFQISPKPVPLNPSWGG